MKAHPGAKKTALGGKRDGVYKVHLAAPPVDGKANEELVRFLAVLLDVPRSAVRIARGVAGRMKMVEIDGVDPALVERVLNHAH